ncbi:hypothetical protein [Pseudomonas sp. UBA6323]|nr:hypothetical protein [Pseudomonas sp. UBA6323]
MNSITSHEVVLAKAFAFALWLSWGDLQSNACAGKTDSREDHGR